MAKKKRKTKKVKLTNSQKKILAKRQLKMRNRLILKQFNRLRLVFKQLRGEIDVNEQMFLSEFAWETFSSQLFKELKKGIPFAALPTLSFSSSALLVSARWDAKSMSAPEVTSPSAVIASVFPLATVNASHDPVTVSLTLKNWLVPLGTTAAIAVLPIIMREARAREVKVKRVFIGIYPYVSLDVY